MMHKWPLISGYDTGIGTIPVYRVEGLAVRSSIILEVASGIVGTSTALGQEKTSGITKIMHISNASTATTS